MADALVLCYHAVSERWPADLSVRPAQLREQLALLVSRGYRATTFAEAVTMPSDGRVVAVTFDDGYESVLTLAAPILAELGIPGTVFVPTDFPGTDRPMAWPGIDRWLGSDHEPELMPLSWPQLAELAQAGWEVGSHSCSHPRLTALDDDVLADELRRSRAACQGALGRGCQSIAYPYGDVDERVVAAAATAGYSAGAGLPARPHAPTAMNWPRVGVYHPDRRWRFRLKASSVVGRLRAHSLRNR